MENITFKTRETILMERIQGNIGKIKTALTETDTFRKNITAFGIGIDANAETQKAISKGIRPDVTIF